MMTERWMDVLTARGIDVELAVRLGLDSVVRPANAGGERLAFPFKREGKVVRTKLWTPTPAEGWSKWLAVKGGLRIPYNEDCLRDPSLANQPLVITEGEFDCVAALQSALPRTISVPDGAPEEAVKDLANSTKYQWLEDEALRPLLTPKAVKEIVLATDGDAPGAALQHDLSILLGRFRCKFIVYPLSKKERGRERCKDLNEVLEDYGPAGVRATIERAKWLRVGGLFRMSELPKLPPPEIVELKRFSLLNENLKLRLGAFMDVTGIPGFGKTTWVNDIVCEAAVQEDLTVAWFSPEQEPQTDQKRNLRQWFCQMREGDLDKDQLEAADRWIEERHLFIVPDEDQDADFDWLLDTMEAAVCRHGARILVIDPWNEIEHCRRPGENETDYTARAIRVLKRFAKRFKVLVIVVAHPTKSIKDGDGNYRMPTPYDISGSAHWYNKADYCVVVHREKDRTLIKIVKVKHHATMGKPGTVAADLNSDTQHYHELERVA